MEKAPAHRAKPPCRREDALAVLQRLRQAGHIAYFAGGCVRDMLMGHPPADWDIATDAPPPRVRQLFSNTQAVGQAFGVILVRHAQSVVEVATFRTDDRYLDGRRPSQVRFTTPQEDAQRRDFTINALFHDPLEDKVIDFVGGRQDLEAHLVRAVGQPEARFAEDHLRLLRAVRFAARFSFTIEPATAAAIAQHAPLLTRISPERTADELRLMLTPTTRSAAWQMLWTYRLVDVLFRFMGGGQTGNLDASQCIFMATAPGQPIGFGLALAAAVLSWCQQANPTEDLRPLLQHASVKRMVRAMRQALKISNDESEQMAGTLEGLRPLLAAEPPGVAPLKRFLAGPQAADSRLLLAAIRSIGLHVRRIEHLETQFKELAGQPVAPTPLISGDDLAAAGLKPGPLFGRLLAAVYDAQLEDRVRDKAQAMELALSLASSTAADSCDYCKNGPCKGMCRD
jgi:poly(A) polymerase